ncbi:MAG TPA: endo-1,4-beta-xylanase [Phycisphaerae bacterium]|nr:endo-1,4-beta-xylanase [Phycisphaerae bacterium]
MLRFTVNNNGGANESVKLDGAYLVGSDNVPLRADIQSKGNEFICNTKAGGPAALALVWPVKGGGRMVLETTRLPERDQPYNLQVELLRGRLMRIAQKREDWGLFDFEGIEEVAKLIDLARDQLIAALQADTPAQAAEIADNGIAMAIRASEQLTAFHAEIFLNRRKQVAGFPKRLLGTRINPKSTDASVRELIPKSCDFISIPFSWRDIEPREKELNWQATDDWIDWASRHHIPVRGSGLVSFTKSNVPDWLYIWEHDFEAIRDLVYEHLTRVIKRYGQYVSVWDVISGIHAANCFQFNFEQLMELTRMAVSVAKQTAPRSLAVIDIVMPWGEYYANNQRTIPPMLYAEMVMQNGLNFDAFGVQCCLGVGAEGRYVRDIFSISSMLDRFANFGKPVHVTGIQVPSAPSVGAGDAWEGKVAASAGGAWHRDWSPEIQRAWMRRVYHIALSKPFIESLTWQDFCEDNAHFLPHAGLVCADGKPKPAYEELVEIKRDLGGDTDGHATRSAG